MGDRLLYSYVVRKLLSGLNRRHVPYMAKKQVKNNVRILIFKYSYVNIWKMSVVFVP